MKVLFIMVDTLRYDALRFTNPDSMAETKELDDFAAQSCFFDNAYIASFPTVPNREDVNRGLYTFPHHGWGALPDDAIPLPQVLSENGYTTQLLADTPHLIGRGHRYHRGFQGYHWIRGNECDTWFTRYNVPFQEKMPMDKTRTDELYYGKHPLVELADWIVEGELQCEEDHFVARTASLASKWIEQNYLAKDFFLWVDTFQCHEPWRPPQYLTDRYDPDYKGFRVTYPCYGYADCYTQEEIQNMRANYAGEVTMTSKWVGHLLRKLKDVGIYDDTLIIIKSDHGNYIGEHNRAGKMFTKDEKPHIEKPWPHFEEVTHIPLMIKLPGQKTGVRIKEIVQPVDIMPTILDVAGVKSGLPFDGLSLKPLMTGEKVDWPRKYAFSAPKLREEGEVEYWTTITGQGWTMMLGGEEDKEILLYNTDKDPKQEKNVLAENLQVADDMGMAYMEFLRSVGTAPEKMAPIEKRLRKTLAGKVSCGCKCSCGNGQVEEAGKAEAAGAKVG